MAKKKKKRKITKKHLGIALLILAIISLDLGIYFFYYAPKQRTAGTSFFSADISEEIPISAFVLKLSLSNAPEGKIVTPNFDLDEIFQIKSGESAKIYSPVSSKVASVLERKHMVRDIIPTDIIVSLSRPEGVKTPKGIFDYKEPPFMTDLFALLAYKNYVFVELVPFYWKGKEKLSHLNRMLVFPDEERNLTNKTVYIEYVHLIGVDIIGGPDVKKIRVASLDNEVISFIKENYEEREDVLLSISNETFIRRRGDIFKYQISQSKN